VIFEKRIRNYFSTPCIRSIGMRWRTLVLVVGLTILLTSITKGGENRRGGLGSSVSVSQGAALDNYIYNYTPGDGVSSSNSGITLNSKGTTIPPYSSFPSPLHSNLNNEGGLYWEDMNFNPGDLEIVHTPANLPEKAEKSSGFEEIYTTYRKFSPTKRIECAFAAGKEPLFSSKVTEKCILIGYINLVTDKENEALVAKLAKGVGRIFFKKKKRILIDGINRCIYQGMKRMGGDFILISGGVNPTLKQKANALNPLAGKVEDDTYLGGGIGSTANELWKSGKRCVATAAVYKRKMTSEILLRDEINREMKTEMETAVTYQLQRDPREVVEEGQVIRIITDEIVNQDPLVELRRLSALIKKTMNQE